MVSKPGFKLLLLHFVCSEEQISAMRKELEKYGIQMPAFSKIGGILESEVCEKARQMCLSVFQNIT